MSHAQLLFRMLPVPGEEVVFKRLEEGAVLFHATDEVYFGLNSVGARIWELLSPTCRTLDDLCNVLDGEYPEAEPEQVRQDVQDLLDELLRNKLVRSPAA